MEIRDELVEMKTRYALMKNSLVKLFEFGEKTLTPSYLDERPSLSFPPIYIIGMIEMIPCMHHLETEWFKIQIQIWNTIKVTIHTADSSIRQNGR